MTRDDIIRMALEAGANLSSNPDKWDILEIRDTDLERFAALVAAHEREECAKVCEEPGWNAANWCAKHIRARGEK
jgi:hypothetical protein